MLDIFVAQVQLNRPGVVALVGEIKARRMPQHVGVNREFYPRMLGRLGNHLVNRPTGDWTSTQRTEQIRTAITLTALPGSKCAQLGSTERMR